jgi:hypothetical protein
MALNRVQIGIIAGGLVIIISLVLVYFFVLKHKPKVVNSVQTAFTVDGLGNVADAQGIYVGRDNGDDTFTTPNGDIIEYVDAKIIGKAQSQTTVANTTSGTPVVVQSVPGTNSVFNSANWSL